MSQVTLQGNASGTGIFTVAAPNSNTNRTLTLPDATGTVVTTDATQTLTNKSISGAQINSGTVAVARLGSGTPGSGNFLRGDGSWQTVPASPPSTADVLNATAGGSYGAVGTYLIGSITGSATVNSTASGASIRKINVSGTDVSAGVSGTWRSLGGDERNGQNAFWLRIS